MSSKKLILSIIVLMILFAFFMRFTLISLQKEAINIDTYEYIEEDDRLNEAIKIINGSEEYNFLYNISVLMIDHISKNAAIWSKDSIRSIKYNEIPDNIIKANSFYLEINNKNTLLINIDSLLGDFEERLVSESYKYIKLSQNKLNPYEVDFFPSKVEDVKLRYFRNMIIEELIKANSEKTDLRKVKYFFDEWESYNADDFNFVAHYDIYEGFKEYYKLEVKEKNDSNFNLYNFIENKRNEYGFFQKEDEYKIIGILLIEYSINNNMDLIREGQSDNNIYKNLLYKTPLISYEPSITYKDFALNYKKWEKTLPEAIDYDYSIFENSNNVDFTYKEILTENYDYTFKINDNYYLYFNYKARFIDNSVINLDYIIVHISPNSIEYYYDK
jgi:hypothetical protein